ncbi:myeloid-associated differentiation marker-like [Budorcas taxicolor]|uniref:myeloid-associated differentiation marker-like n=1 Tax=Budorcas taxicolor TaxID=37181 RepID=UPI0022852810|nr:myeloid-associated differentiation marker-like [Budorcas taxicolor]
MGCCLRQLQLFSTCMAFSLGASVGTWKGAIGNWSMFIWCFCFVLTLLILIVELCGLEGHFPFSWDNFLTTCNCYSALLCLSASIIYPVIYIQFLSNSHDWDRPIISTAFSCIAFVAYAMDVTWTRAQPNMITGYMATVPGLLKGLETIVACVIFVFLSNTSLYLHQPALEWCVAVYSICFVLSSVAILVNLGKCDNRLPIPFSIFQVVLTLLSVLLYTTALLLWPLYQFNEELGRPLQRSSDVNCSSGVPTSVCIWDQQLAVVSLTAINLLIYVTDLVFSAHLNFNRG